MSTAAIQRDVCLPNTNWVYYDRVVGLDGTPITQAGLTSVVCTIHVVTSASASFTETLSKTDVVFDRLQTKVDDPRWDGGDDGFNFRWSVPAAKTPTAGVIFRYRVKFVQTDGAVFYIARDRAALDWGGPAA